MMTPKITPEDCSGGFIKSKYQLRIEGALREEQAREKSPAVPWPPKWLLDWKVNL